MRHCCFPLLLSSPKHGQIKSESCSDSEMALSIKDHATSFTYQAHSKNILTSSLRPQTPATQWPQQFCSSVADVVPGQGIVTFLSLPGLPP